jgi:hypothetical protein
LDDSLPEHLRDRYRNRVAASAAPAEDHDTKLPYGWLSPDPVLTLHFQWPDGTKRGFRYIHLDSDMEFTGDKIVLRFFGSKPVEVTITGRNLERVYLGIGDDRWRVLRQQARDFAPDGETYIGTISICSIEPSR